LFGVLLVPAVGTKFAILLIAAAYLVLVTREFWSRPMMWGAAAAAVTCAVWAPSLAIVDIPAGGRLVSYQEGAMASVSIVEDAGGTASLHINNRQQEGSTGTVFADARQALLPILLHAHPRRALFLGLGTGVTSAAAAGDPALSVDAVELLPEVIEASKFFTMDSRVHLMAADARRFVRASDERYDVIVADNFHPARSGSGALYTVEHFNAVRERLTADGVFCQWLPLHQLDLETTRSIARTFLTTFPHALAILATNSLDTPVVGLVGHADDRRFDFGALRARLADATVANLAANFDIADDLALFGSFIAGPESLVRFAGEAPLNTDDRPVVAYRAPRVTYAPDSQPRDRLIALLNELHVKPDELLSAGADDEAWSSRLMAYWTARNRFIQAGRDVRPAADVRLMLSQVEAPLLEVLHVSPDFRPAYDPLLGMANALGRVDARAARDLLSALAQAAPSRPEATQMLRNLPSAPERSAALERPAAP
jgi:spermidine synthase